jgi:hypothetical protein
MEDAEKILSKAEEKRTAPNEYVRDVANYFHENEGELTREGEALATIMKEFDLSVSESKDVLAAIIGDIVDPVVQLQTDNDRYVGVINYNEYEGAYGYTTYNDVLGEMKRVVCAQCVKEFDRDKEITHATEGKGSFEMGADFDELLSAVHEHYEEAHDTKPEDVKTGADLLSGTTIANNSAYHTGNDGNLAKQNVGLEAPIFATTGDVPTSITEGELVYISGQSDLFVEDGT